MKIDRLEDTMKNSCECGICSHHLEQEYLENEYKCCSKFPTRSEPK